MRVLKSSSAASLFLAGLSTWTPQVNAQDINVDTGRADVQVRPGVDVNGDRVQYDDRRQVMDSQATNGQISSWLAADQQSIVQLAQFGLDRTKTPEVRDLAQRIIRDHQALADELARAGSRSGSLDRTGSIDDQADVAFDRRRNNEERNEAEREARRDAVRDQDGVRRPLENLADRIEDGAERLTDRAERVAESTRDAIDRRINSDAELNGDLAVESPWVNVHQEISREVAQAARMDLERYQGYEFDAAFVGMLSAAELQQQATLKVFSGRASGELANSLNQAVMTVSQNREAADRVMGQIQPRR